jgi:hypothetical protein
MSNNNNQQQPQRIKNLEIGQVIYILSDKSGSVVPAIVAEESVIKTLQGNNISWKLHVGPESDRKVIDSRQINGEVYSSLEEVKRTLFERLHSFLKDTIQESRDRAKKWYGDYYQDDSALDDDSLFSSTYDDRTGSSSSGGGKDNDNIVDVEEKYDAESLLEAVEQQKPTKEPAQRKKGIPRPALTSQSRLRDMMPSEDEMKKNIITDEVGQQHVTGPQMKKIRMPDGTYRDIAVETDAEGGINIL